MVQLLLKGGDVDLSEEEIVDGDRVVTVAADLASEEAESVAVPSNTAVTQVIVLCLGNKKICYARISTPFVTISTLTWRWTRRGMLCPTSSSSTTTLLVNGTMPGVAGASFPPSSRTAALYFWHRSM